MKIMIKKMLVFLGIVFCFIAVPLTVSAGNQTFTPGNDENASFVRLKNNTVVTVPCASDTVAYHIYKNSAFK